jgi:pre-mRNA-splicing factor ATP-dependent RNA helicase DHX38/PRP16
MVHDFKPPFLDGKTQFSTNMETIQVVKDPNSDMALLAKKGSAVVKDLR